MSKQSITIDGNEAAARVAHKINEVIAIYPIITGYAIVRYRLMDISLAMTRTGIFVGVYSLILGIPFAIAFGLEERLISILGRSWWLVPLVTSTVLAIS